MVTVRRLKDLYHRLLAGPADTPNDVQLLCHVLTNIHAYLVEEELKMIKAEAKCNHKTFLCLYSTQIQKSTVLSFTLCSSHILRCLAVTF